MSKDKDALRRSLQTLKGNFTRALSDAETEEEKAEITEEYGVKIATLESQIFGIPLCQEKADTPFAQKSKTGKIIDVFKAVAAAFNLEEGEIDEVITNDYDFIYATLKNMYDQILESDFTSMPEEIREYMVSSLDFIPFDKREVSDDVEGDRLKNATLEDCLAIALTTKFVGSVSESSLRDEACALYQDIHHRAPDKIDRTVSRFIKLMTHPNVNILTRVSTDMYDINLNAKVN